jgi:hypothetical protein
MSLRPAPQLEPDEAGDLVTAHGDDKAARCRPTGRWCRRGHRRPERAACSPASGRSGSGARAGTHSRRPPAPGAGRIHHPARLAPAREPRGDLYWLATTEGITTRQRSRQHVSDLRALRAPEAGSHPAAHRARAGGYPYPGFGCQQDAADRVRCPKLSAHRSDATNPARPLWAGRPHLKPGRTEGQRHS